MKTTRVRSVTQRQQRIDIGAVIGIGRDHRRRAAAPRGDIVDRKAVAHVDHLVARPGIALRGKVEQFVRAGAHHDPRRIDAVQPADRARRALLSGSG
jgi:hypothetical protein